MSHEEGHVGPHQEVTGQTLDERVADELKNQTFGDATAEKIKDVAASAIQYAEDAGKAAGKWIDEKAAKLIPGSEDARGDYNNYLHNRYKDFFPPDALKPQQYPEDLFQSNQPNAVGFYILTRKSSIAAKQQGNTTDVIRFGEADEHFNPEYDTSANRASSEMNAQKNVVGGAAAVSALGAGLSFFKGNGDSSFGSFLNKGAKVVGATAGAAILSRGAHEGMTEDDNNSLTFLDTSIHLHVPQSVITQYQADWQGEELGVAGALANRRSNQTDGAEIVELLGRGIISAAANIPRAAGIGNADFASSIEATTKKLNNPFKEQLFKSIGFRKFAFGYTFSPRNESEAMTVERIINLFKYHMHPEISPGQMFLVYPSEFLIEFLHVEDGQVHTNHHMPRIAGCALTDVKITYGPDGTFQTIKDTKGMPSEITMELSFTELETLTANRIAEGY